MDEQIEPRIARNEAIFREVNEALQSGRWPTSDEPRSAFRCECAQLGCSRLIELSTAEYERIRAHPRWFFIDSEHAVELAETVVERHGGYVVVEKHGIAGRLAEATDPRA